ncbi:putative ATP-dependent helicase [Purpureocillium lavendulum]|uniref:ATP-dependent helicase n=1 Tax=Purpureocillium lavendulum TaxID=1247861 RepID=A0AB34G1N1_9HYPO|nr:putative ATP-dependent helicase [Purpureocillium lavendulum]
MEDHLASDTDTLAVDGGCTVADSGHADIDMPSGATEVEADVASVPCPSGIEEPLVTVPSPPSESPVEIAKDEATVPEENESDSGANSGHRADDPIVVESDGEQDCNEGVPCDEQPASGSDAGSDFEDEESSSSDSSEQEDRKRKRRPSKMDSTSQSSSGKPFPRPKNARQFMANMIWSEKQKAQANKRKTSGRPKKSKTGGKAEASSMFSTREDQTTSSAPSMPELSATTHATQLALLKQSIPEGSDVKRVKTQQKDLDEAVKLFGFHKVKATNGKWLIKDMISPLDSYQITAAAWMVKRELGRLAPFGGLLGDVMGMGKTVTSLACIVGNPADKVDKKKYSHATLVVVPSRAIAQQWLDEVHKHCDESISDWAAVYAPKDKGTRGARKMTHILITTYTELMNQYPAATQLTDLQEEHGNDAVSYEKAVAGRCGYLFQRKWYRIILDEAHAIKNIDSRSRLVCCALEAKYHWCLSGTPLANSTLGNSGELRLILWRTTLTKCDTEFLPYLQFLGCSFTNSPADFKTNYMLDGKSNDAFDTLASMIMYRRTMNDTFLGMKIIDLPKSYRRDIWVPLSDEENTMLELLTTHYRRLIEDARENRAADDEEPFGSDDDSGEATPEKAGSMNSREARLQRALLVKLRQAYSHCFTLERILRTQFSVKHIESLKNKEKSSELGSQSIIDQWASSSRPSDEASGLDEYQPGILKLQKFCQPVFGGKLRWGDRLDLFQNELRVQGVNCSVCDAKTPTRPVRLCINEHYSCGDCFMKSMQKRPTAPRSQEEDIITMCPSKNCKESMRHAEPKETFSVITRDAKQERIRDSGRDAYNVQISAEGHESSCFIASDKESHRFPMLPSSKLTATFAVLSTWLETAPEDKIVVFLQFRIPAKVLGYMLDLAGLRENFLYYFGSMTTDQRAKALKGFKEDPTKKILVASLKCGGHALNITEANRVIVVDPWWNETAEQQAFARVMRRGQQKTTHFVRIMASASFNVDSRIALMQTLKSKEISYALQDDGHARKQLNDEELQHLLNPPKDEKSTPRKKARRSK